MPLAPQDDGTKRLPYAALFRPHSRAEAISAPSRIDLSLSQTTGSITHSRRVKVPKPQSVEATTRSRSPTAATASSIRRATTSGCSTKLLVELHDAGDEDHVLGERHALQRRVFVRVPRIGELDRQRADFGLIERRQNLFERDIVDVRPFPIAVTDMQPHAVGRNALDAFVDHRHMQFARLDEVGIGAVAIEHGAVHGEVGASICNTRPAL